MVALVIDSSGSRQQRAFHKGTNVKTYATNVNTEFKYLVFDASIGILTHAHANSGAIPSERWSMVACTHRPLTTTTDDEIKT